MSAAKKRAPNRSGWVMLTLVALLYLYAGSLNHTKTFDALLNSLDILESIAPILLIVAFFYASAIKLPWLPMMISYFGLGFTVALTFFILLGALIQGMLADRLLTMRDRD